MAAQYNCGAKNLWWPVTHRMVDGDNARVHQHRCDRRRATWRAAYGPVLIWQCQNVILWGFSVDMSKFCVGTVLTGEIMWCQDWTDELFTIKNQQIYQETVKESVKTCGANGCHCNLYSGMF